MIRIFEIFKLSEVESNIFEGEIIPENIRRLLFLSFVAVPVSVFHILYFRAHLVNISDNEHLWRLGIIYSHLTIAIILSVICILIYFFSFLPQKHDKVTFICIHVVIVLLLIGGAVIASIDQLVTSSITPFLITTMVISFVILVKPFYALIYFAISYVLFFIFQGLTQANESILISNRVNGITVVVIGFSLSVILWRSNMTRHLQKRQIAKQKDELQNNYNMLQVYSNELKELNTTKDKFISIIAHDLKGPFNLIMGFSNQLIDNLENYDNDKIRNQLDIISNSSRQTHELLENLLLWANSQRDRIVFNPELMDLRSLVLENISYCKVPASKKEIKILTVIDGSCQIMGDRNMINTILRNLISNAIKFTPHEGEINISMLEKPGFSEVSITDSGIGIEEARIENLFRLDSKLSTKGTDGEHGSGLGLVLCKEFVERHGGKISVESRLGSGSRFVFSIPVLVKTSGTKFRTR